MPASFAARYEVELNPEQPGDGRWRDPVEVIGDAPGVAMAVRVTPHHGTSWVAKIRSLEYAGYLTALVATPDPDRLCVIANGEAMLIGALDRDVEKLPVFPVTGAMTAPECDLLVLADFNTLVGIGRHGLTWRSIRLAIDGLELMTATSDRIECHAEDFDGSTLTIGIDPTTGEQIDGPVLSKVLLSRAERRLRRDATRRNARQRRPR